MMMCSAEAYNRVFIQIGNIPIYWYGVIIAAAAFIGLVLANREADRLGLPKDTMLDLLVFALPIAIISARLYYVIFEWKSYVGKPWTSIFAVWEGGLAIHGALIGSVITAIVFTRVRKLSFWQIADIAAPSLILGQAIGRWGNFMNQEAHGGPISEGTYNAFHQYLPDFIMNQMCIDGIYYHPTFLYESVWNVLVLILLLVLRKRNPLRGELFLTYIMSYSVGRFFIEGMRTDSLLTGHLKVAEVLSIILIISAIVLIIYRRKVYKEKYRYDGQRKS